MRPGHFAVTILAAFLATGMNAQAQMPPRESEIAAYRGLHAAAANGDVMGIAAAIMARQDPNARDDNGRTPLHVSAFLKQYAAARGLIGGGADPNALDRQQYDIVTIAAVANDPEMLKIALNGGASAKNVTSPYRGTALIAAAHLGHAEIVGMLIAAGAPLDHINNLGWTALIESIVLGDGGPNHTATLRALVEAGVNVNLADRNGATPLTLATQRGFKEMISILSKAGAKP